MALNRKTFCGLDFIIPPSFIIEEVNDFSLAQTANI